MNVATLMESPVATVHPSETLDRAVSLMRDRDCGCTVVVDDTDHTVGIVTDRDVCLTTLHTNCTLADIAVRDAMTDQVFTCHLEDSIETAERSMSLHQVRRLPVLDDHDHLVGLLSLDDIAREANCVEDLLVPPVSCAAVGRTLGQIARPHLIEDSDGER